MALERPRLCLVKVAQTFKPEIFLHIQGLEAMSSSTKPVMRFVLFAKRREDLTPEQFYEHWEKVHAPLTAPWLVKHKVLGYSQVLTSTPSPPYHILTYCRFIHHEQMASLTTMALSHFLWSSMELLSLMLMTCQPSAMHLRIPTTLM